MTKPSLRIATASFLVALGIFVPFINARFVHAQGNGTQATALSESQQTALLQSLLDKLIDLLKQLYPQVDWTSITTGDAGKGITHDEGDDDDDTANDDDDDNDSNDRGDDDDNDSGSQHDDGANAPTATAPIGNNAARANFDIPVTISAFGDDMYIEKSTNRDASPSTSEGATYVIEDGTGAEYTGGAASATLTDKSENGDTSGYFKINEGDARTFILHIAFDNTGGTQGFYSARIVDLAFDDDTTPGGEQAQTLSGSKYKTTTVFVDDTN